MTQERDIVDALRWGIRQRLVERLRIPWDWMGDMANQQRAEAAVQIVTMMDEIEAWKNAMQKAERDIAELRTERDEARRKISHLMGGTVEQEWFANRMGWDCFKENA